MENESTKIMSYQPKFIEVLENSDALKLLDDENYNVILEILNKQSMTARELTNEYVKKTGQPKSTKSIYRYINKLKSANLVVNAGQLITAGKMYTERIYAPSAMTFYKKMSNPNFWDTTDGIKSLRGIYYLLTHNYDMNFSENDLKKILKSIDNMNISQLLNLDKLNKKEFSNFILDLSVNNFNTIINYCKMLILLFNDKSDIPLNLNLKNNIK